MRGIVFHPELLRLALGFIWSRAFGTVPLFRAGPVSLQSLEERPLPGPGWVRVRCRLAGICGSDLRLLRMKFSSRSASLARRRTLKAPMCLGHEAIGEVLETGPAVNRLKPGDRVALIPGVACASLERERPCAMCSRGLPLLCLNRDEGLPVLAHGAAWSECFLRHYSDLLPLPDSVPDDQAILLEPLASSVHAVLRRPPARGETALVIGCGMIGLGTILAIRALGIPVRIIAIARHGHQTASAKAAGADAVFPDSSADLYELLARELGTTVLSRGSKNRLLHEGAAVVYDAVGSGSTLHHALRWAKPRGTVILIGINACPAPADCTAIWLREVDLLGSHGHGVETLEGKRLHTFGLVLEWITQRRLIPDGLITHRFPLNDYRKAIAAAASKLSSQAIKVVLELNHHDPACG